MSASARGCRRTRARTQSKSSRMEHERGQAKLCARLGAGVATWRRCYGRQAQLRRRGVWVVRSGRDEVRAGSRGEVGCVSGAGGVELVPRDVEALRTGQHKEIGASSPHISLPFAQDDAPGSRHISPPALFPCPRLALTLDMASNAARHAHPAELRMARLCGKLVLYGISLARSRRARD
jgi:hypothetical protein